VAGYPRFDVVGQVALVTGAARGLGRAVALALANAGADVALGLRDLSSDAGLVAAIEATGRKVLPVQCEVGDIGQVHAAVDAVRRTCMTHAERAAREAERRWPGPATPAMANAIREVHDTLANVTALRPTEIAACCFPNQPLTIVPLALGLATVMQSAEAAILLAANIGGDSDSVASIAGGILGALYPDTVNQQWDEVVEIVNRHHLAALANTLAGLRRTMDS